MESCIGPSSPDEPAALFQGDVEGFCSERVTYSHIQIWQCLSSEVCRTKFLPKLEYR